MIDVYMQIPADIREKITRQAEAVKELETYHENTKGPEFTNQTGALSFATVLLLFFGGAPTWVGCAVATAFLAVNLLHIKLQDREFNRLYRATQEVWQ